MGENDEIPHISEDEVIEKAEGTSQKTDREKVLEELKAKVNKAVEEAPVEIYYREYGATREELITALEEQEQMKRLAPDAMVTLEAPPIRPGEIVIQNQAYYRDLVKMGRRKVYEANSVSIDEELIEQETDHIVNHELAHADVALEDPPLNVGYGIRFFRAVEYPELLMQSFLTYDGTLTVERRQRMSGAPSDGHSISDKIKSKTLQTDNS